MPSYNRIILMGHLTRDPELKYLPSGTAVVDFGIAVNDRVKKNDVWVDEAMFADVTFFGRTAEVCNEYLTKGAAVLVEGRLKLEQWEKDGVKRSKHKVIGDKMQMVGAKGRDETNQETSHADDSDWG
jgi:single-strand DNA-binding protein